MKRFVDQERGAAPAPSRRLFLKGAVAAGILMGADIATRPPLSTYQPREVFVPGADNGALTIFHHGFQADVKKQTHPVLSDALTYGDVMLMDDSGSDRYDAARLAEFTAEKVTDRLKKRKYARAVFVSVSLGGIVAHDALTQLTSAHTGLETSTQLSATFIDTPVDGSDLQGFQEHMGVMTKLPFGGLSDTVIRMNNTAATRMSDEARSIYDNTPPIRGDMGLESFVSWRSTMDTLVRREAGDRWLDALETSTRRITVSPAMGHAALEQSPDEARSMFVDTMNWHTRA